MPPTSCIISIRITDELMLTIHCKAANLTASISSVASNGPVEDFAMPAGVKDAAPSAAISPGARAANGDASPGGSVKSVRSKQEQEYLDKLEAIRRCAL